MTALAANTTYRTWAGLSTGALYRMPVALETVVEPVPGIDAAALIGRLSGEATEATEITIRRDDLGGIEAARAAMVRAPHVGAGLLLMGLPAIFEPTPFTIESALHADTDAPAPAVTGDGVGHAEPTAYRAFKDLARWLDAEDGQVADMVGIGRTTPYAWKREGREPRAATAQHIYEYHATLDALRRRLGVAGLRRWLHEGVPTRRDALLAGDLAGLERDVHAVLFRRPITQQVDLAAAPADDAPVAVQAGTTPVRPSGRRPRRPAT